MNPVIMVLCTAAICLSLEQRWNWVGPILLVAFIWALAQNAANAAFWQKILKK